MDQTLNRREFITRTIAGAAILGRRSGFPRESQDLEHALAAIAGKPNAREAMLRFAGAGGITPWKRFGFDGK